MFYINIVIKLNNMAKKKVKWYEVRYFTNGEWHQEMSPGRREMRELHKRYPGSFFREYYL